MRTTPFNLFTQKTSRGAGFTLIEVIVASGILVMATGGIVTVGRAAIQAQDVAMERTQAYELAQEALEIVRQIRDTQVATEAVAVNDLPNWSAAFPANGQPVGLVWDTVTNRWRLLASNPNDPTIAGGAEEIILSNGGASVTFTRTIEFLDAPVLDALTDANGVPLPATTLRTNSRRVRVTVRWSSQGEDRSVTSTTLLTNWKRRG